MNLQKDAWTTTLTILQSSAEAEATLFAATTLKGKVRLAADETPHTAQQSSTDLVGPRLPTILPPRSPRAIYQHSVTSSYCS